jgi:hypothetical protein
VVKPDPEIEDELPELPMRVFGDAEEAIAAPPAPIVIVYVVLDVSVAVLDKRPPAPPPPP